MKASIILMFVLCSCSAQAEGCIGHVFFYNIEEDQGDTETESDFSYYYHKSKGWLDEEGLSNSAHTALPVQGKTCFGANIVVPDDALKLSLGYVLVKPNEEIKVYGGVMTGVDLSDVINDFFKP